MTLNVDTFIETLAGDDGGNASPDGLGDAVDNDIEFASRHTGRHPAVQGGPAPACAPGRQRVRATPMNLEPTYTHRDTSQLRHCLPHHSVHQLCRTLSSWLHCDHGAAQCTNRAHRVARVSCAEKTVDHAIPCPEYGELHAAPTENVLDGQSAGQGGLGDCR